MELTHQPHMHSNVTVPCEISRDSLRQLHRVAVEHAERGHLGSTMAASNRNQQYEANLPGLAISDRASGRWVRSKQKVTNSQVIS